MSDLTLHRGDVVDVVTDTAPRRGVVVDVWLYKGHPRVDVSCMDERSGAWYVTGCSIGIHAEACQHVEETLIIDPYTRDALGVRTPAKETA